MTQPALLLWKCDCGWFGTAAQMTAAYACPQCGGYILGRGRFALWNIRLEAPLTDACRSGLGSQECCRMRGQNGGGNLWGPIGITDTGSKGTLMDTVSPDFTRTTEIVLCQISRGVAPVMAIVGAVQAAQKYGWEYLPITGLPLVEAKNHAFFHALEQHRDLVLIEDDILVDDEVWDAIANSIDQVGYARTRMRTGEDNVVTNADGQFMYTGNCLCMIPLPILQRLPRPPFESRKWSPTKDTLDTRPSGLMQNGVGSDTGFWYHVRHLDPAPEIVEVGQVRHLRHEFNIKRDNLTPIACEITEW